MAFLASLEDVWKIITLNISNPYDCRVQVPLSNVGFSSSSNESAIILDSELNQLHIIKGSECPQKGVYLLTPQPLERYTSIDVYECNVLLQGKDTVGVVELDLFKQKEICKKVSEIYTSKTEILSAKWFPDCPTYLAILTTISITVMQWKGPHHFSTVYRHCVSDSSFSLGNSFGLVDEFVDMDFGTSNQKYDNCIFILKESGEVLKVPNLSEILKFRYCIVYNNDNDDDENSELVPESLRYFPQSSDNYSGEYSAIVVIRLANNEPNKNGDVLVLCQKNAVVIQHAVNIDNYLWVYEEVTGVVSTTNIESPTTSHKISAIVDRAAYPPRYLLIHNSGIHSIVLPWVLHLRSGLQRHKIGEVIQMLKHSSKQGHQSLIDCELLITGGCLCGGVTLVRQPLQQTKLCIFLNTNKGPCVKMVYLRQESTLLFGDPVLPNTLDKKLMLNSTNYYSTKTHFWDNFIEKLGAPGRLPSLILNTNKNDESKSIEIDYILKLSECIATKFEQRIEEAGRIMDIRKGHISREADQQYNLVNKIETESQEIFERCKSMMERVTYLKSKKNSLENRLIQLSDAISGEVGSCRENRDAILNLRRLGKKVAALQALNRSCKFRLENCTNDSEISVDNNTVDLENDDIARIREHVIAENDSITRLTDDIKMLLRH